MQVQRGRVISQACMDSLLSRLERRFGRYTLPGFTYAMVVLQAFVFVVDHIRPGFSQQLLLDRTLVLQGQFWRLFTYLFIPPSQSPFWVLFALYWLYTMGNALESEWGAFKYQLFWLVGMLLTTVVAFAFDVPASNVYLLMSLFLAFATLWPDDEIRVFFLVPVKAKWLALLDVLGLVVLVVMERGLGRLVPIVAVGNYLLFFASFLVDRLRQGILRARRVSARRALFRTASNEIHRRRCVMCGVTDEDPSIEFRVCTCDKCGGRPTEFCLLHARNH